MAACQDVRTWITRNVLVPVTQFITEVKEKCEELRRRIEELVNQPVYKWISRQEARCRAVPWWSPVRWFCEIATIVAKILVWEFLTMVKWFLTTSCQLITYTLGILVTLLLRLLAWLVNFIVCLITDTPEALNSFRDLWAIVLDTVEDGIDFALVLLDDVDGILGDIEDLIDSVASSLGWLGVTLGPLKGIIHAVRNAVDIVRDSLGSLKDIVLGVFSLNLCRVLRGLTDLGTVVGRMLLATGFGPVAGVVAGPVGGALGGLRGLGYLVGGVRDSVDSVQLEGVITSAINNAFGAGSARATRALRSVGLNVRPMGLTFHTDARRLFLSSDSTDPNLRTLHDTGVVNLYSLAGYSSDCKDLINQPDGEVVYAGTDLRVSYADLDTFLASGPGSVPEFHAYAITRAKFRAHLEVARRKAQALGIQLFFPTIGTLRATSSQHMPLSVSDGPPLGDAVQQQLFGVMGRTGVGDDLSLVPTVSHFHYVVRASGTELFGLASWFRPSIKDAGRSGVTYRNRTPDWAFRWVLAHELGHYWGLNHANRSGGDRGLEEIMFAPSTGVGLTGSAVLEYLALGGEPRFTLDDARTAWDWITTDGAASLLP
jgi:hypothetical protein